MMYSVINGMIFPVNLERIEEVACCLRHDEELCEMDRLTAASIVSAYHTLLTIKPPSITKLIKTLREEARIQ